MKHLKTFESLYDQFNYDKLDANMQRCCNLFKDLGYEVKIYGKRDYDNITNMLASTDKSITFQQFTAIKNTDKIYHKFEMWEDYDQTERWYVIEYSTQYKAFESVEIKPTVNDLVKYIEKCVLIEASTLWDIIISKDRKYLIDAPDYIAKKYSQQIGKMKDFGILENNKLDNKMQIYFDVFSDLDFKMSLVAATWYASEIFHAKKQSHNFEMLNNKSGDVYTCKYYKNSVANSPITKDEVEINQISDLLRYIEKCIMSIDNLSDPISYDDLWDTLITKDKKYLIDAPDYIVKKHNQKISKLKDFGILD